MTDELILNMFKLFYANYTVKNCISLEKYVSGFSVIVTQSLHPGL